MGLLSLFWLFVVVSNIYIRHIESNTTVFFVLLPNLNTEHSADDFDFGVLCSLCVFFECVISASFSICALMHTNLYHIIINCVLWTRFIDCFVARLFSFSVIFLLNRRIHSQRMEDKNERRVCRLVEKTRILSAFLSVITKNHSQAIRKFTHEKPSKPLSRNRTP